MKLVISRLQLIFILATSYLLLATIFSPSPAHAAACDPIPPKTYISDKELVDKFNRCAIEKNAFDDKIFNWNQITGTVDSLNVLLGGSSDLHPDTNVITQNTGALAATSHFIATLYSAPPASGVEYLAWQIQRFNPVQPAYAQTGVGYDALKPVQGLWTEFRNASYIGFVIVFVVIGFMVMFRAHISPQAVATVQDSLPRLVIALILVTFSYAIVGLMIDAMFLGLNIAINLLGLDPKKADIIFEQSFFGVIMSNFFGTAGEVGEALGKVLETLVKEDVLKKIVEFSGGNIAKLVALIALLFILFRVFFMLLMAYVMIIVLTIAAPFFFLFQALPGRNAAGAWFRQIGANIATFAVVGVMILLAAKIGGYENLGADKSLPLLKGESGQFPLLAGGLPIADIGKLIAFGFLLMTPGAAQMVKEWLSIKGGGAFGGAATGGAIGGALGGAAGAIGGAGRMGWQFTGQPHMYAYQTRLARGPGGKEARAGTAQEAQPVGPQKPATPGQQTPEGR